MCVIVSLSSEDFGDKPKTHRKKYRLQTVALVPSHGTFNEHWRNMVPPSKVTYAGVSFQNSQQISNNIQVSFLLPSCKAIYEFI